jgi:hypothetical protein
MNSPSKSDPTGVSKDETTETRQVSPSSGAEPQSNTSVTSATSAKAKSPKGSQPTVNLQDVPNVVNLLLALGDKLIGKKLAFWKQLKLKDGSTVYALCFPTALWKVDPKNKKLTLR